MFLLDSSFVLNNINPPIWCRHYIRGTSCHFDILFTTVMALKYIFNWRTKDSAILCPTVVYKTVVYKIQNLHFHSTLNIFLKKKKINKLFTVYFQKP
jgi:hypothetical protein